MGVVVMIKNEQSAFKATEIIIMARESKENIDITDLCFPAMRSWVMRKERSGMSFMIFDPDSLLHRMIIPHGHANPMVCGRLVFDL